MHKRSTRTDVVREENIQFWYESKIFSSCCSLVSFVFTHVLSSIFRYDPLSQQWSENYSRSLHSLRISHEIYLFIRVYTHLRSKFYVCCLHSFDPKNSVIFVKLFLPLDGEERKVTTVKWIPKKYEKRRNEHLISAQNLHKIYDSRLRRRRRTWTSSKREHVAEKENLF